jgi:glycine/D-amino acid oxidase-like deaminating enzyme
VISECTREYRQMSYPHWEGAAHRGAYMATGHNVWGILNAPATGEALAELIVEGVAFSADLAPFDLIRIPVHPIAARTTDI